MIWTVCCLNEPEALTTLEREPDSLPTPADDIGPASPIQLAIPPRATITAAVRSR